MKGATAMTAIRPGRTRPAIAPTDCWYVLAPSESVGRAPHAYQVVGLPLVVFRTVAGQIVALHDRCAHRPYPLSAGRLDGDELSCGLCGFVYGPDGQCVRVPTQAHVPVGAAVRAYPIREEQGLVWVWAGEPGRAWLHRLPDLPWLIADGWISVGGEQTFNAQELQRQGAARALTGDITAQDLRAEIEPFLTDPAARVEMASRARSLGRPDAARALASLILSEAGDKTS